MVQVFPLGDDVVLHLPKGDQAGAFARLLVTVGEATLHGKLPSNDPAGTAAFLQALASQIEESNQ